MKTKKAFGITPIPQKGVMVGTYFKNREKAVKYYNSMNKTKKIERFDLEKELATFKNFVGSAVTKEAVTRMVQVRLKDKLNEVIDYLNSNKQ